MHRADMPVKLATATLATATLATGARHADLLLEPAYVLVAHDLLLMHVLFGQCVAVGEDLSAPAHHRVRVEVRRFHLKHLRYTEIHGV